MKSGYRRTCFGVVIVLVLLFGGQAARAQMMPGMEEPKKEEAGKPGEPEKPANGAKPRTPEERREALAKQMEEEAGGPLRKIYLYLFSEYSPYRGLLLAVLTLLVLLAVRKYTTNLLRKYAHPRMHKGENLDAFLKTWNGLWKFVIGVFVVIALSGSLQLLGLSAAFLGMILGWSLQAPVTGLAAWLMIILKRPFRIGDRVIIAGIIGDVTDITLTHVVLNQVGGTVGGEERSGRGVLIPNAILFGQVIMNYTLEENTMLDEVPIRLTFDSDWDLARQIMLDAGREVTADLVPETKQELFTRCEFFDAGVMVRLRYQTLPPKRQEISSRIVEKILAGFKKHYPAVKFCYPRSVVRYQWDRDDGWPDAGTLPAPAATDAPSAPGSRG